MSQHYLSHIQWRLILLSETIKEYPTIAKAAEQLMKLQDADIMRLKSKDVQHLTKILQDMGEIDMSIFLKRVYSEWEYRDEIIDLQEQVGICELCQEQRIRYEHPCYNKLNGRVLKVGSVCVGQIIYGEKAMDDPAFAREFKKSMEDLLKAHKAEKGLRRSKKQFQEQYPNIEAELLGAQTTLSKDNIRGVWIKNDTFAGIRIYRDNIPTLLHRLHSKGMLDERDIAIHTRLLELCSDVAKAKEEHESKRKAQVPTVSPLIIRLKEMGLSNHPVYIEAKLAWQDGKYLTGKQIHQLKVLLGEEVSANGGR